MKRLATLALPTITILALAGALLWSCGGGDSKPNPMVPGGSSADVTITIVGQAGSSSFSPNPATVTEGQTVAWRNTDGTTHSATADNGTAFGVDVNAGTTSAPITMNTLGSFDYHCRFHTTMVGTLVVNPAP